MQHVQLKNSSSRTSFDERRQMPSTRRVRHAEDQYVPANEPREVMMSNKILPPISERSPMGRSKKALLNPKFNNSSIAIGISRIPDAAKSSIMFNERDSHINNSSLVNL